MVDKNSIFGGMLTTQGAAKKTNCDALGIPWEPRYMLIGDANGTDPVPSASQTKLVNQVYRAQLNQLRVSPTDSNVLIAELVLPPDVGGWWIRELALEDKDGVFCAVANAAPSYKPLLAQGSGRNQVVRMHIITSGTSNIQLKIDPSVVLATRGYVDDLINGLLPANKVAGTYTKVTVNDRGVFMSGSNPTTLAGFGIKDTYTKTEIESMIAQASALPVGATVAFPLDKVAPGFLELDGSVKSVAVYPDLAAFLGTAFNKGDEGAGNFRLPDSRGEFLRGWDHGRGVDAGRAVGSWQVGTATYGDGDGQNLPVPNMNNAAHVRVLGLEYDTAPAVPEPISVLATATATTSLLMDGVQAPGTAYNGVDFMRSRPRNIAVVWCIKAWNAPINQGNVDVAALLLEVQKLRINGPVVGSSRNAVMTISIASLTATFNADELIVEDAAGSYRINKFAGQINLAAVGAGGMDSGAAPTAGFVAIYAIYNPATKASALVARNATSSKASDIYDGSSMPAGYTASALVSVWRTQAGKLVVGYQENRRIHTLWGPLLNGTTQQGTLTAMSIAGYVPINAKTLSGQLIASPVNAGTVAMDVAGTGDGVGGKYYNAYLSAGSNGQAPFSDMPLIFPQTLYYIATSSSASAQFQILASAYTF